MSIDTTIFRTADLLPLMERLDWNSPNTLEAVLANNPIDRPLMACDGDHYALNIPANRVQGDFANRTCHGRTAEELNRRYLEGQVIDIEPLLALENNSCHLAAEYRLMDWTA